MPSLVGHTRKVPSARHACRFLAILVVLLVPLSAFAYNPTLPAPYIKHLYGRIALGVLLALIPTLVAIRFARLSAALKKTIAEKKQNDDELRKSEALYRATLNASPDGITITDMEGRIRTASPAAIAMFKYEREEDVIGRPVTDFLVPEEHERATSNIALMFQGIYPGPSEYRALHADGSEFYYEVNGEFILDADGQAFSMVFIGRDVTERKRAKMVLEESNRLLEALSITDGLTGLANRRRFDEVLTREHARHVRSGADLSLILLDIDHFKAFNDSYGHVSGDDCLRRIARVIAGCAVRAADLAARYGGEEFACILPETDQNGAAIIAEKIRLGIMGLAICHNSSTTAGCITASFGVVTITCTAGTPASDIVVLADKLLYKAKSGGRNRIEADASNIREKRPDTEMENNLVQLVWKNDFCSGNHLIDTQHLELFRNANELLNAVLSERPNSEISALVMRLLENIAQHFHDEEVILECANFPGLKQHAEEHTRLYEEGLALAQTLQAESPLIGDIFKFLVYEVVLQHLLGTDREFFPFVRKAATANIALNFEI